MRKDKIEIKITEEKKRCMNCNSTDIEHEKCWNCGCKLFK